MARRTGFKPDEHLDLSDKGTMSKLVGAIAVQEGKLRERDMPKARQLFNRAHFGRHGHAEHHKHMAELTIRDNSGGLVTVVPQ
jgi:hypothetical protein